MKVLDEIIVKDQLNTYRMMLGMFRTCYEKGLTFKDSIDLIEGTIRNTEKDMEKGEGK